MDYEDKAPVGFEETVWPRSQLWVNKERLETYQAAHIASRHLATLHLTSEDHEITAVFRLGVPSWRLSRFVS